MEVRSKQHKYPFCIVWTPIPVLSWLFPFIGHMGIGTSKGLIRDFAGSYFVSEDMAFGWPTMYMQFSPEKVDGGIESWDRAILEASEEYHTRIHNLCCDNCHSFVALALNKMRYNDRTDWDMLRIGLSIILCGKFVNIAGFLKQYLPSLCIVVTILIIFIIAWI